MPNSVKNLIKTGMRNPFVVEIMAKDELFATKQNPSSGVSIQSFDTFDKNLKET